ncbi:MAG: YitT family protein [Oscillospiraceae bacterium]|nr:YitT family protein [Oscillospiraceae bacterium]
MKKVVSYLTIVFIGFFIALSYQLFVFPNNFAPAGINGIFTMIQHLFGFKLSNASLLINLPLAIWVYFKASRPFALRGMLYVVSFSFFLMILERMDLSAFVYSTTISTLLGPAVAGLISGVCGYYMHQMGSCLGGTEFIAKLIHKKKPSFNFFSIVFLLNSVVAVISYFVYDYKIEPVLLCIIYSYFSSNVRDNMNRKHQSALRCEIVTEQGDALGQAIIKKLHHSVTKIPGTGLYTGRGKDVLMCVVNPSQLNELTKLVAHFPGSFVTISPVSAVMGNFARLDSNNNPEKELLDSGIHV